LRALVTSRSNCATSIPRPRAQRAGRRDGQRLHETELRLLELSEASIANPMAERCPFASNLLIAPCADNFHIAVHHGPSCSSRARAVTLATRAPSTCATATPFSVASRGSTDRVCARELPKAKNTAFQLLDIKA